MYLRHVFGQFLNFFCLAEMFTSITTIESGECCSKCFKFACVCIKLYLDEDVCALKHMFILLFSPPYAKVCSKMLSSQLQV